jgi:sortase (surface protein transpeptidase)
MIKTQDKNQMNLLAMSAHRLHVKNAVKLLVLVKNLKNTFTDYIEMSSDKDQENQNKTKEDESLKRKQKEKQEDDELESLEVESTGGGMGAGGGG